MSDYAREQDARMKLADLHSQFVIECAPWVDRKAWLFSMSMPTMTISADGKMESVYRLSADQKAFLDSMDMAINAIRRQYEGACQPYLRYLTPPKVRPLYTLAKDDVLGIDVLRKIQ